MGRRGKLAWPGKYVALAMYRGAAAYCRWWGRSHRHARGAAAGEERWGAHGRCQGLRARSAGATMPFEFPIRPTEGEEL